MLGASTPSRAASSSHRSLYSTASFRFGHLNMIFRPTGGTPIPSQPTPCQPTRALNSFDYYSSSSPTDLNSFHRTVSSRGERRDEKRRSRRANKLPEAIGQRKSAESKLASVGKRRRRSERSERGSEAKRARRASEARSSEASERSESERGERGEARGGEGRRERANRARRSERANKL